MPALRLIDTRGGSRKGSLRKPFRAGIPNTGPRMGDTLRGHSETIGPRMERDLDALLPLLAVPYGACDRAVQPGQFVVVGQVLHQ